MQLKETAPKNSMNWVMTLMFTRFIETASTPASKKGLSIFNFIRRANPGSAEKVCHLFYRHTIQLLKIIPDHPRVSCTKRVCSFHINLCPFHSRPPLG